MTIYTQGSFDILHNGHIKLLKKCRKLAGDGKVVVALLTDASYEKYRGHKPARSYSDRKIVMESCTYVDEVVEVDNKKTGKQIQKIKPDFVVLGTDWAAKDIYKQYGMTREELDPLLLFTPYTVGISSTEIKKAIKNDSI